MNLPVDERNGITRIFHAYHSHIPFGLSIHLKKRIPIGGGLGGGSSNMAGFLVFLNQRASWGYSVDRLRDMGKSFGADVPFFITGGTALVEGIGEKVAPVPEKGNTDFVLIYPRLSISTVEVYKAFDHGIGFRQDERLSFNGIEEDYLGKNDLKGPAFQLYPELVLFEKRLLNQGISKVYMSGSGSTLFFPCENAQTAQDWTKKLAPLFKNCDIISVSSCSCSTLFEKRKSARNIV